MSRAVFLDRSAGEARGVVTLNGKPERLLIERDSDIACQRLSAVMTARVALIDKALATAFLQLPEGREAILPIDTKRLLVEGASLEIEITAEARRGKGAVARLIGPSSGPPRLIKPGLALEDRLALLVPSAAPIIGGDARQAADEAQDAAVATVHPLPGGGSIAIEATRALTAVDVDLGSRQGGDAPRAARQANLAAINEAARLLRLKGLSGLIVIDLAGKGHDGAAMSTEAKRAFAPDGAGVSIGPISRFGLFELAVPRTTTPIADRLLDETGALNSETVALDLLRALEREGRADPGARLVATAAPEVAAAARPHEAALTARLGPRFAIKADPALARPKYEILSR